MVRKRQDYSNGKTCTSCKEVKPLEFFSIYTTGPKADRPRSSCKACMVQKSMAWAKANPEKSKARDALYYARNKISILSKVDRNRKREYDKNYKASNPNVIRAQASRRRASKNNATPVWANKSAIDLFFLKIKELEQRWDVELHGDHIVPLKSKYVCGLHVEYNLQILSAEDNLRKHNSKWPDMPVIDDELKQLAKEFYASQTD